jgi:hypothetical protein
MPDGRWSRDITTGGQDERATAIMAYLLPAGYTPVPTRYPSVAPVAEDR